LDRTFITPFDREDIHTLVGELDDIIDGVDALAKRFPLFHVKKMEELFIKQTDVLLARATHKVDEAVHLLRHSRKLTYLSEVLIGDIHQPLHSTSLFSPEYPNGDQGGNAQVVLRDSPYPDSSMKLHLLWDELPGDFSSEELIRHEADGLRSDVKYSREKMRIFLPTPTS
jgi:hypothetical protein